MSNTTVDSGILSLQLAAQRIYGYGALILIIFGTIGNLLNIFVFIRLRTLRQIPSSIFLITCFTANIVQLWTTRFSQTLQNLTGVNPLTRSLFYCEIRWLFGRMSSSVSMTSICLVSIDRFLITSRNLRYHRVFNMRRVRIIVVIMILIFFIPLTPDIVYYWTPSCVSPGAPYWYRQYTNYFNLVLTNYLSAPVLALFGTLTWRNIRTVRLGQHNQLETQVTRMIFAELVMVCVTAIPNIISSSYSLATQSMVRSQLRIAQDNLWSNVCAVIAISSYAGSFYVFCAVSSSYRKNVRLAIRCKKQNRVQTMVGIVQNNIPMRINNITSRH